MLSLVHKHSHLTDHESHIREVIRLAGAARSKGNHPFGALLVHNNSVILRAENTVCTNHDRTNHAEMNLLRQAQKECTRTHLEESILYASTEPCAMCSGAIYWIGIRNVVFGCSAMTLARHATGSFAVPCRDIFNHGRDTTLVIGPLLESEAEKAHEGFWKH